MTENVSFIPYSVLAATMAIEHHLAGGIKLQKEDPPVSAEWVQPTSLSRPVIENREGSFSFTAKSAEGGTWKVTMRLFRREGVLDHQWVDRGPGGTAEYTPPEPPKPRTTKK